MAKDPRLGDEAKRPYNPGDSAGNVQNPSGVLALNHLLGSSGSQKWNATAVSPTGMYSGQRGGRPPAPGEPSGMLNPNGGGQTVGILSTQAPRRTDFTPQNPNRGQPSRGNRSGAPTASPQHQHQQHQQQQQQKGQGLPIRYQYQNLDPWQEIQNPAGQQLDPDGWLSPNQKYEYGSGGGRFQPVSDNLFQNNADATNTIISGRGVVGETDGQWAQREVTLNDSLGGGARNRFNAGMALGQPGMITAMAGAQGGMGMGGYGADGRPVSAFDADVGAAYTQQGALESMGAGTRNYREAQGLQQAQNSQNQYTQDLMNNIDSAASSTLSNQLGSVGSQMEAAGLGRSGANGLASTRMGEQVLGNAMRDKMNVLSQQSDRMSGQTFMGQQNMLGRLGQAEDSALGRMQNTGMGVTDAQTARLMNEENVKAGARGENLEQFAMGDNVDRNARNDMLASEAGFRGTEQERQNSILSGQQAGFGQLMQLGTGISQQPIDWRRIEQPRRQNPGIQLGGNFIQGAASGYFGGDAEQV